MNTWSVRCARASSVFALIAFEVLNGGGVASATSYTITVDASNQTAGNPRFWAASVGTGTASLTLRADLQTHYKLANRELGMQRVRGHGVLSDDMGIAALCSEVGHGSKETKKAFTGAIQRLLTTVEAAIGHDPGADRERVLFAASAAVGAMVLARATHDESLAGELLSAVRKRLLATNEKAPVRRRPGRPD